MPKLYLNILPTRVTFVNSNETKQKKTACEGIQNKVFWVAVSLRVTFILKLYANMQ